MSGVLCLYSRSEGAKISYVDMTDRNRVVPSHEDPQMGLPRHIIDAASRCGSERGSAEDVEVVRNWIEQTQNINATYTLKAPWGDISGHTLLFYLACNPVTPAKLDLVRQLIARGADVNIRNSDGKSPLHNATFLHRGASPALVSLLLDAGAADLNTNNGDDMKPLASAMHSSSHVRIDDNGTYTVYDTEAALKISRILLRAGASLDRVIGAGSLFGEMSAEQLLAHMEFDSNLARDENFRTLKNLVYGTRTRRAIARLRSYAIRGRVTAEVRLLDDGALAALARVKLYNSLFGLPHVLFKEIVSKL